MTLFDILNYICDFKANLDFDDPDVDAAYDIYLINRYLSSIEIFIPFVEMMNRYDIPKRVHYTFFKNMIPKNRYRFSYMKKNKDDALDKKIACMCKYYEIGKREAVDYLELMKPEQIDKILKLYSYGTDGKKTSLKEEV